MKSKTIVTAILLAFVAFSIGFVIFKEVGYIVSIKVTAVKTV